MFRASELEHWVTLDDMDVATLQGIEILRAERARSLRAASDKPERSSGRLGSGEVVEAVY